MFNALPGMTELRAKRVARVRDGGKCLMCGSTGGGPYRIHGHHIFPKGLYPESAADPDNIATLCMICHMYCVHSANPADGGDPKGNWRKFAPMLAGSI